MSRTTKQNATYPQKIACLILLASEMGHPFVCAICGHSIEPGQRVQFDHGVAVGVGGENTIKAIRPVHADKEPLDCHERKTSHPRGQHTSIDSDTHAAAKVKRILGETGRGPSKPLQSRPFQKAPEGHKHFRSKRDLARLHEEKR